MWVVRKEAIFIQLLGILMLVVLPGHCLVDNQPQQVHLSLGADATQMVVTWLTMNTSGVPIVQFGEKELSRSAEGWETKFVDGGSEQTVRWIQRVILTDLTPGNKYRYRCGGPYGWSSVFSFTALRQDPEFQPRIAVFGDLGNINGQSIPRLQQMVQDDKFDFVFHDGDFAYNLDDEEGNRGDEFMRQVEPFAAYVPYQVAVGNHEQAYNFSHYVNRFTMINSGKDSDRGQMNNHFYSFNIGPVHVISFSTEFYFFIEYGVHQIANQFRWLEEDLKEAQRNRDKQPWIVTMGHRPMYCSDDFRDDCSHKESIIRKGIPVINKYGLEDLFYKYGVDLEIWGHEHVAEVNWPLYDRKVYNGSLEAPYTNPKAPIHFTSGSAGCQERLDNFVKNPPEWSRKRMVDYGFTSLTFYNASHLHFQQISDDQGGEIIDDFWLIKDHHGPYN